MPEPLIRDDLDRVSSADGGISLDDWIAHLAATIADPPDDADLAGLIGAFGSALSERYERDADPGDLDAIIGRLSDALHRAPQHDDRFFWWYGLGLAHAERARLCPAIGDFDEAVEWFSRLYAALPGDDEDRDDAAVVLIDAHLDRFWFRRYRQHCDVDAAGIEANRLVTAIEGVDLVCDNGAAAGYVQMLTGLGHLERFEITGHRADLDLAIEMLAAALPGLPLDVPRRGLASAELSNAYRLRADADGDLVTLDLAIRIATTALETCGPEDPEWRLLHEYQSHAYALRANLTANVTDLTSAIEHAQLLADEPAGGSGGAAWHDLAEVYRARWLASHVDDDLDQAYRCIDTALAHGGFDDDELLRAHNTRLAIGHNVAERDSDDTRSHSEAMASAARLRGALRDADQALNRAILADLDLRAMLAAELALIEIWVTSIDNGAVDLIRIRGLLSMAALVRDRPAGYQTTLDTIDGLCTHWQHMQRPGSGTDRGVEAFARARAAGDAPDAEGLEVMLSLAIQARSTGSGDRRARGSAVDRMKAAPEADIMADAMFAVDHLHRGDHETFLAASSRLADRFRALPPDSTTRANSGPIVTFVLQLAAMRTGKPIESLDLGPIHRMPGLMGLAQEMITEIGAFAEAVRSHSDERIRTAARRLASLNGRVPARHFLRLGTAYNAGLAELEAVRHRTSDVGAAQRAVELLTEAKSLAGGPEHPLWSAVAMSLAEAMRMAHYPDLAATRVMGLSALEGHAWQVALQSGTDFAVAAARGASEAASTLAGWCLQDGAYDDLVTALDAGRGLVLNASVLSRDIARRLEAGGHADLAAEWSATRGRGRDQVGGGIIGATASDAEVSDNLRLRVLHAIRRGDDGGQPRLLEPIGIGEIQAGLIAVGADALSYLIPADGPRTGLAVVVPAVGRVEVVPLPSLVVGPGSLPHQYLGHPSVDRVAGPVGGGSPQVSLDAICQWAWWAGSGQLVTYSKKWRLNRPARLVLVPMGELALVPWHAAYVQNPVARRYAIADLIFSYNVSARMFCAAARRPVRPIRSALIVGNPTGDLVCAGMEAQAIKARFYRDGTYFGQPSADAVADGTPAEVLTWIQDTAAGPSMLHFACHARGRPDQPSHGYLLLAGAQQLTADELLETCRLSALEIGQVFLAACTTSVTGVDYDEAFSLATVFLTSGAQTVFGSLWPVPDAETSLLMYMVHHFLVVEAQPPSLALHRAQLWMINPHRRPPEQMPPVLRALADRPQASDPVAWAGFTHFGR